MPSSPHQRRSSCAHRALSDSWTSSLPQTTPTPLLAPRADDPLRHYLSELRALYPALPGPLLGLLEALAGSPAAAADANAYLAGLPALTCLHALGEPGIAQDANAEGQVVVEAPLPLPGARALTLPAGGVGEVLLLPEGLDPGPASWRTAAVASGLWAVASGPALPDPEQAMLVRWRLPLSEGTGLWVLLCRGFEALEALGGGGARARAALAELTASLHLLAAICSHDPGG